MLQRNRPCRKLVRLICSCSNIYRKVKWKGDPHVNPRASVALYQLMFIFDIVHKDDIHIYRTLCKQNHPINARFASSFAPYHQSEDSLRLLQLHCASKRRQLLIKSDTSSPPLIANASSIYHCCPPWVATSLTPSWTSVFILSIQMNPKGLT